MLTEKQKKSEFIIKDLTEHTFQSSWDWEADQRFVDEFYPEKSKDMYLLLQSASVVSHRFVFWKLNFEKIKNERMNILRELSKQGITSAQWGGVGAGNTINGIRRVRVYSLTELGKGLYKRK